MGSKQRKTGPRFPDQSERIEKLCADAGLGPNEMADRIGMKHESMRKVMHGYNKASDQLIRHMEHIVEWQQKARRELANAGQYPLPSADTPAFHERWAKIAKNDPRYAEMLGMLMDVMERKSKK